MTNADLQQRGPLRAARGEEMFQDLYDLLGEFAAYEEIGTDDVLGAVLPLMRQTLEAHDQGMVAPLDGVEALGCHRGRLYFGPGTASKPVWSSLSINRMQGMRGDLDIAGLYADTAPTEDEIDPIGVRGMTPTEPVFLPDYRCWEHAVGNHDPLTDIFSLGMIAASLAFGLNFTEERDLARFVSHRRQLTQLNGRLHPVVASVITHMTELDRRRRVQDLRAAIHALETHRQVAASGEAAANAQSETLPREDAILTELRGRLYDLTRRNKLLFHKPSSTELNLTEASTPIVLRVEAIRQEQIFYWRPDLAERLTAGKTLGLSEFVRFEEMLYPAPALDKIRSQARKDRTEFGFSQLRLVIAFLRWRNLKDDPETPISSPLLLLPVELKKRRGVRDSYDLKATASVAEVNPALRRYLKLIYGVDLPSSIDLEQKDSIETLHRSLSEQIMRSEPGVKLMLRDAPDVAALHSRAMRKVDLYRRRVKPTSNGLKRIGDISYSYSRTNWRPLGLQMHRRFVSPSPAPARRGKAAQMALPLTDRRQNAAPADAARSTTNGVGAARMWEMDLCSVTLANFNYRKMSLVHDFDALLEGALKSSENGDRAGAFSRLFSNDPKPIAKPIEALPVDTRFEVMESDPTQAAAVSRARTGESYVIQGPPGTGKSQTIANLIADYVGRGKRVLFVCEKRAALDVVHNRLEGLGLHRLCARVHDSQEDKRDFVLDLKSLYENWMGAAPDDRAETARRDGLGKASDGLASFSDLDESMTSEAEGEAVHKLISRAAEARRPSGQDGDAAALLDASEMEILPSLTDWRQGRDAARAMEAALRRMGSEPVLARHPARFVSAEASSDPDLFERLGAALAELGPHLKRMGDAASLAVWDGVAPLAALFAQIDYAARLAPVATAGRLRIMNPVSNEANTFRSDQRWLEEAREALERAQEKTKLWTEKLSDIETERALDVARAQEGKLLSFMSPTWRQVRTEVEERCKLHELTIKPLIKDLLADLMAEHEAAKEVERHLKQLAANIGLKDGADALQIVAERDIGTPSEGARAKPLLDLAVREHAAATDRIHALAALKQSAVAARNAIETCFEGLETLPVERAFAALSELEAGRDSLPAFAPALRALAEAPDSVRAALRRVDASVDQIEGAIVDRAVERALAVRPQLRELSGAALDETSAAVHEELRQVRKLTAETLLERARRTFVEHVELTTRLDLELDPQMQVIRRTFVEARRDLDRELSKTQRFRSVRELMAGPAGMLVRDLKPIWLMSPLSVADVLPLDPELFDVVIFDEASQVPIEEAAPTLFRAPQAIVVGDEKQLPPTNFFGGASADDDVDAIDSDTQEVTDDDDGGLDLDAESFLAQAAKTLPSTLLGWHYRSRSEELIAFSNAVFYAGKLISIPSTLLATPAEPIIAASSEDGAEKWGEILARPVSFHHTPFAVYEKQKNAGEAAYIAEMIRGLLKKKTGKSLGVVAFSEAQQAQIEKALETLAKDDAKFRELLEAEYEREEGGQFEGLFVKNLENVQGDERDVIVISVCYGPDKQGRMRMNFGPINRSGGEKRLNVIFSRAKEHVALVSTIKGDAITNDYNTGALCLKTYLKFADAVSRGDQQAMRRALATVAPHASREMTLRETPIAETLASALRDRGWEAEAHLGESAFVCDVAVRRPGGDRHELAVLIDGPSHYACKDVLERHVTRPGVLKSFGWKVMTVLALDWRRNPEEVLSRIEKALDAG